MGPDPIVHRKSHAQPTHGGMKNMWVGGGGRDPTDIIKQKRPNS